MKKILSIIIAALLILSLAACTNNDAANPPADVEKEVSETPEKIDFSGKTLNVVTTSEAYVPLFEKFSNETGAKVEFL